MKVAGSDEGGRYLREINLHRPLMTRRYRIIRIVRTLRTTDYVLIPCSDFGAGGD